MYLPGVSSQSICSGCPKRHLAAEATLECTKQHHARRRACRKQEILRV